MKVKLTSVGVAVCLLVLLGYGLVVLALGVLNDAEAMARTSLIPPDSQGYALLGEEGGSMNLSIQQIALGSLNWSTLPLVYGYFQTSYAAGGLFFVLFNCFAMAAAIGGSISLLTRQGYVIGGRWLPLLLPLAILICMPYTWGWVLGPNKEIIVGAAVVGIMLLLEEQRSAAATGLALLAALTKIQFLFAMALYLCTVRMRYRKAICLISLSLVLPVALRLNPNLTVENLVAAVSGADVIRTAWFFEILDKICAQPLGFVIVAPVRFVANCLGGLYPQRLLTSPDFGTTLGPATSLILGLLCMLFLILRSRTALAALSQRGSRSWHFFYCYILVSCIVPFLQPRYFWWLIPLMVTALLASPRRDLANTDISGLPAQERAG